MAIINPTGRLTSVRKRCVIEVFGGVFVLSRFFFSVGVEAFVIGLSQISLFFSYYSANLIGNQRTSHLKV